MSGAGRELVVLGTSAQTPTRERNHNGYVLRWDDETIMFDPGEGAQRQLLLAGVSWASITAICITPFHGDHCLGLPGATFLEADGDLARSYRHLTARQAGWIAADAQACHLVLTHFSPRYQDTAVAVAEATSVFPEVIAVRDLDRVPVPPRAHQPSARRT